MAEPVRLRVSLSLFSRRLECPGFLRSMSRQSFVSAMGAGEPINNSFLMEASGMSYQDHELPDNSGLKTSRCKALNSWGGAPGSAFHYMPVPGCT